MQTFSKLLMIAFAGASLLAQDPLTAWLDAHAQRHLDRRDQTIASIRTKVAAQARQQQVRAKILELIGGLPDYNGPLNARVTGKIENSSYTMEKVAFESLPGYIVTANLYRPNKSGRYPAVLLSTGHTTLGRPENHRIGANLAAKGFVALVTDPVGLGERIQALDPRTRRHAGGCCANEHLQAGALSILIGQSVARYFIWDAKRGIDYLVSRSDVDSERIGAAGCSGGGCLTTYIAALDPRVKAAAPACFINSLRLLFKGPFPDSEMSLPGFLAAGLDHADFIESVAPLPWLILATEGDFFTPPAVKMVYDEARRWYGLYSAQDNVAYLLAPRPHGTPLETREALYGWMIRWLNDGKSEARETEIPLYPDADLQVTQSGQVLDEPGSRKLHEVIRSEFHALRRPRSLAALTAELRRLGIPTDHRPPAVRTLDNPLRIAFLSEPGVEITGTFTVPAGTGRKPALLLLKDAASEALAQQAAAAGNVVLELEPRDAQSGYDKRPYLGNWVTNARADSIGRNLAAMRAHDILRGVDVLTARPDVDPSRIHAAARDVKGVWVLLAAAADSRIRGIWLDRTPPTLASAMDSPLNINLFDAMIRGFLLHWDLPDLVRLIAPRAVLWSDPADWMARPVFGGAGFRYRKPDETAAQLLTDLFKR